MPTVALIDDHEVFRSGLSSLLALEPPLRVVAEAGDADSGLQAIEAARPDVVVMDLSLPGSSGVALSRELLRRQSNLKILALSASIESVRVAEAFDAGILGYAVKTQSAPEVIEAIQQVAAGRPYLAPIFSPEAIEEARRAQREAEGRPSLEILTHREREVFDLTVQALSSDAIGRRLSISRRTVETHRSRILRKLGCRNATELAILAARLGVLQGAVAPTSS